MLKNGEWTMSCFNMGNVTGVKFYIRSDVTNGVGILQYTNVNNSNDYTIRVSSINIPNLQTPITLLANTNSPLKVEETQLAIPIGYNYFQLSIYVNVPLSNKYALYEIQGVVYNNLWSINSRYIGDYTGIKFYITTINGIGYLTYTNINNTDANIRYIKDIPLASLKPLNVTKGGTGSTYLNPYTILRGNGTGPIIGTNDLIYKDNSLIVGTNSTIVIRNTSSCINLTTGSTFVAYGGVSINKELFIGKQLVVKDVDITPNTDDISAERIFNANNNQTNASEVSGFNFENITTKSFSGMACVTILTNTDELDALYEIKGLKKKNGWIIDAKYIGDETGITFTINNNGQIKYTSTNQASWVSTTIKFRALTTTY